MNLYGGVLENVIKDYMEGVVNVDYNWVSDDLIKELLETEEVKNMLSCFFNGSVKVIVVLKFF